MKDQKYFTKAIDPDMAADCADEWLVAFYLEIPKGLSSWSRVSLRRDRNKTQQELMDEAESSSKRGRTKYYERFSGIQGNRRAQTERLLSTYNHVDDLEDTDHNKWRVAAIETANDNCMLGNGTECMRVIIARESKRVWSQV